MRRFSKSKPVDDNEIAPSKLNSSKVITNLESGISKKLTKSMLTKLKASGYDKSKYMIFDSALESRYYSEVLLPMINERQITVEFQPKFTILEKTEKEGIKHMAVTYTPDFKITYFSGKTIYVDVKGMLDQVFPIKRKMFDAAFPDLPPLVVMKYAKKYGGWITIEEYDKAKREEKKQAKASS
jgi:hypothetical protein